jgi:L-serine dehydratase
MLEMCAREGRSIAALKRANELTRMSAADLDRGLDRIWEVMSACIDRGLVTPGTLPGGLNVRRRAKGIHDALEAERGMNLDRAAHDQRLDLDLRDGRERGERGRRAGRDRADERRGGGDPGHDPLLARPCPRRVAPRRGGLPADRRRHRRAHQVQRLDLGRRMRLPGRGRLRRGDGRRGALRGDGRHARAGGERGRDRAGAPSGHDLRPGAGLVQVPCIERNGLGAIKAVSAASLALRGDGTHFVPLDAAIETMRQTGEDMSHKYKETALGGLAVNVPNC